MRYTVCRTEMLKSTDEEFHIALQGGCGMETFSEGLVCVKRGKSEHRQKGCDLEQFLHFKVE